LKSRWAIKGGDAPVLGGAGGGEPPIFPLGFWTPVSNTTKTPLFFLFFWGSSPGFQWAFFDLCWGLPDHPTPREAPIGGSGGLSIEGCRQPFTRSPGVKKFFVVGLGSSKSGEGFTFLLLTPFPEQGGPEFLDCWVLGGLFLGISPLFPGVSFFPSSSSGNFFHWCRTSFLPLGVFVLFPFPVLCLKGVGTTPREICCLLGKVEGGARDLIFSFF